MGQGTRPAIQAELFTAVRWTWLGPALVRAQGCSEHGDAEGLAPGMRREPSLELAGKRTALTETGAWNELLRILRDLLSHVVDAPKPCLPQIAPRCAGGGAMKLAEICVIEQHIGKLLEVAEPT